MMDAEPRLWRLMSSIRFCMLSTWDAADLRSRPMAAIARQEEGAVYFFADARRQKIKQLELHPRVHLAFADTRRQRYISLLGVATISNDQDKINELWSIAPGIWWKSPSNPNIRIIKVVPLEAEYWDGPPTWISNLAVVFWLLTGRHFYGGAHEKIVFQKPG